MHIAICMYVIVLLLVPITLSPYATPTITPRTHHTQETRESKLHTYTHKFDFRQNYLFFTSLIDKHFITYY